MLLKCAILGRECQLSIFFSKHLPKSELTTAPYLLKVYVIVQKMSWEKRVLHLFLYVDSMYYIGYDIILDYVLAANFNVLDKSIYVTEKRQ